MYRDQFGEFVCGYWGLKGKEARKFFMRRCNFVLFHTKKYTLPKQTLLFSELRELKMFQHKTIMTRKRFHNCINYLDNCHSWIHQAQHNQQRHKQGYHIHPKICCIVWVRKNLCQQEKHKVSYGLCNRIIYISYKNKLTKNNSNSRWQINYLSS